MIFIYRLDHLDNSGSISIFFAIIMVVLITFLFSIFDFTRLQLIQLEATSNFDMASELALSQYDPVLFHQYGIFAGSQGVELESVLSECLETQFYPDKAVKHNYLLDYYLSEPVEGINLNMMEPNGYSYSINYKSLIDCSYSQPKDQILKYMKLREPYLMVKPFLSNLDIMAKSSKTASLIEEKNDLVSSFDTIESYKLKLYELIDGIKVGKDGSWVYLEDSMYVRKFSVSGDMDYSYYPSYIISQFSDQIINFDNEVYSLESYLDHVDDILKSLLNEDPYTFIYGFDSEKEEEILLGVIQNSEASKSLEELSSLSNGFQGIADLVHELQDLMTKNQEALNIVLELESVCANNLEDISKFQDSLETKDDLIESVMNEINNDLNTAKEEMDLASNNFNRSDNMSLIKTQLSTNVDALAQGLIYLQGINENMINYIYGRYINLRSNKLIDDQQVELLNEAMLIFYSNDENFDMSQGIEKSTMLNLINFSENHINNYASDVLFDYSKLGEKKVNDNEYEDKQSSLLDLDISELFSSKGLIGTYPSLNIDAFTLPSHKFDPNKLGMVDFSMMDRGIELDKSKSFEMFDINMLSDLAQNTHDTLLINEYAIGMFSNVNKKNNPNAKSLNGYKLSEHFLDYETEYIIGGYLDEDKNMDTVLRYLYGSRMPLNLIHLAMDHSKRTIIMNIANAIAGWWTGGLGAIIIGFIIAGFWALLESVADIFMLLSGQRVPIIKTKSSWYTSLDGNIMDLFNGSIQRLENEFVIYIEETNNIIDSGIGKLRDIVDINKDLSSNEDYLLVNEYIDELKGSLQTFSQDLGLGIEAFDLSVDSKIDRYIDNKLKAVLENDVNYKDNPFSDNEGIALINSIDNYVNGEVGKLSPEELSLENVITIKEKAVESYKYSIYLYKQDHKNQLIRVYDQAVEMQLSILEESVSELMKQGSKIGRKHIVEKADAIKDEFLDEASDLNSQSGLEVFIPSFSYEDYLRVFLLLPIIDEETKLARIMDLIQLNNQKAHGDYELRLDQYYVGIEVSGKVRAETLFIPNFKGNDINDLWELEVYSVRKNYE